MIQEGGPPPPAAIAGSGNRSMQSEPVFQLHAVDLMYQRVPGSIGSWAIEGPKGWVVVESGPASTWEALRSGLRALDVSPGDVSALLLTHIHLDHAGGAWQFAGAGVPIHVHHVGAPHLVDPARLERSARRVYGDRYDALWGPMRPCDPDLIHATSDGDIVEAAGLRFEAIESLGHANHHHAWHVLGSGDLFTGDAVGMRVPGTDWITVPMPPPEFDPDLWSHTLDRIAEGPWDRFHLTHGGTVTETQAHLAQLRHSMATQVEWLVHSRGMEGRWEAYAAVLRASADPYDVPDPLFQAHASPSRLDMNLTGVDRWASTRK
jgi:glyoxylase-like metal-dependent hydrolase (beta-lactamase superfamily II)